MIISPPVKVAQGEPFAYSARVDGQSWVGYTGSVIFRAKKKRRWPRLYWDYSNLNSNDPLLTLTVTGDVTGLMQFSMTAAQSLLLPALPRRGYFATANFEITMTSGADVKKYQGSVSVAESLLNAI